MDELLGRQLPYSADAEQSVLGAMLIDPDCIPEVVETLSAQDFYIPENRRIFEIIYSMFTMSRPVDPVTVLEELKAAGVYDEAGGRAYLFQMMDVTPTSANVAKYAEIVRDKATLRTLAEITAEAYNNAVSGSGESSDILENTEQRIFSLRHNSTTNGLMPIRSVIVNAYNTLSELARTKGKYPGVESGFSGLDACLGGLKNSDLIILAARPGVGKTSFALNIAQNVAEKARKGVAVFNLEMSREQLVMRMLSSEALVDSKKLMTANLSDDEWEKIAHASSALGGSPIYIDDSANITVGEIKAKCRRLGDELGLVIIDYLQLMQSGRRSDSRVQEVSEISRSLKIMAKELNVPVICLSQLSRASEGRTDKRPILPDLRDSGAIEQDADVVMFLYREDYHNRDGEPTNECECIVAKNRHGETTTVKLKWLGQFTKFSTLETHYDEPPRR